MADFELSGEKWGSTTLGTSGGVVTWTFAQTNFGDEGFTYDAAITSSTQQAAIRAAFAAWEAICNIDFVELPTSQDSDEVDIRLGFDAIDGVSRTLGICHTTFFPGQIIDAEIRFDTADFGNPAADIFATALHEIGHAIGLGHAEGEPLIMNAFDNGLETLQPGDIAGARALYGLPTTVVVTAFTGTAANEKFDLSLRTQQVTVNAGDGSNFVLGGSAGDILTGGTGRDVVAGGAGNDRIDGDSTATGAGDNDQLLGGAGADTISGGAGNDYINGGSENDKINGNAGNDLIYGGTGSDTILGGGGDDVLRGATPSVLGEGFVGPPITVDLDGVSGDAILEQVSLGGEVQTLDLGNDTLSGGAGRDTLFGDRGNDRLDGGMDADTLVGGAGRDIFLFTTRLGSGNIDLISGFRPVDDVIHLERDIMKALGSLGTLRPGAFRANTTGLAGDATDRIIYDRDDGLLIYDSNGSAAGGSTVFATIAKNLAITSADFVVV